MTTYGNTRYRLTITTLTPLHIGTGRVLMRDYDYVTHKGKTWVINEEALAETVFDRGKLDDMARGQPAGQFLQPSDYEIDNPLFRYVLDGEPLSKSSGSQVQVQMKNVFDHPYIPGSSMKGALRTALLFRVFDKCIGPNWTVNDLGQRDKFAAQPIEQKAFVAPYDGRGKDPNYDFMRVVRVSDSTPDEQQRLVLLNVSVVKWNGEAGAPIELEAMPSTVSLTAELTFDGYLLNSPLVQRDIRWDDLLADRLSSLSKQVNLWVKKRLEDEMARPRTGVWRNQFENIINHWESLNADEFMIQLGWGGGWDSKTLGVKLKADPLKFAQIVKKYNLLRKGEFRPDSTFPRTRRVRVGRQDGQPKGELGWIKVRMEPLT